MDQKQLVVANWKMNGGKDFVKKYFKVFPRLNERITSKVETVFCPPFPLLASVKEVIKDNHKLGAQDCHSEEAGAFTGDVSAKLLSEFESSFVIVGHSERRNGSHKENNKLVSGKAKSVIDNQMTPIICVGETLKEREDKKYKKVITDQLIGSIPKDADISKIVIAYEPVWSIGTGKVPSNDQIAEVLALIKDQVQKEFSVQHKDEIRVLYGGSVSRDNCEILCNLSDLDGYLIGSASLKPEDFYTIISSLV